MRISILTEHAEWAGPVIAAGHLLKPLGFDVVEGVDPSADFQIIGSNHFLVLEAANDPRLKQPYGIWERADQEIVAVQHRSLLLRPECRLWLKDSLLRDPSLNNAPLVDGFYHYNLLPRNEKQHPARVPGIVLGEPEFSKIHSLLSFPSLDGLAEWRDMRPLPPDERRIDAAFVGTMQYVDPILRAHRRAAIRVLAQFRNRRVLIGLGAPLERAAYIDAISRSKIIVSPWSMTMCSYKDWEAILAGCVLIKPDSWMQKNYHPDIFADRNNTVSCRPDFADLKDRIEDVLDNYNEFYQRALEARRQLLTCRDRAPIARDLYTLVMAALDAEPDPRLEDVLAEAPVGLRWMPIPSRGFGEDSRTTRIFSPQMKLFASGRSFADPQWTADRASILQEAATDRAPGGLMPVKLIEDLTPAQNHYIHRRFSGSAERAAYIFSFFARSAERDALWVWFGHHQYSHRVEVRFGLGYGTVDYLSSKAEGARPLQLGMVPLEGGWWWCWIAAEFDGFESGASAPGEDSRTGTMAVLVSLADEKGSMLYDGDGCSGAWLAGPSLERASASLT